jgi:hypothetical protein
MAFAARGAQLRCFAAKILQTVEMTVKIMRFVPSLLRSAGS